MLASGLVGYGLYCLLRLSCAWLVIVLVVTALILPSPCYPCKTLGCVMRNACAAYRLWRDGLGIYSVTCVGAI